MNEGKNTLEQWAGTKQLQLVLVFTDIVSSTAIGQELGDRVWMQNLAKHFQRGRELATNYDCFVVKVIGDAFFIAFRNSIDAIDFAVKLATDTGVEFIGIRVGINSGQVQLMNNDIYGLHVNKTARIQSSVEKEGISVSASVWEDYVKWNGKNSPLKSLRSEVVIKNFPDTVTRRLRSIELRESFEKTKKKREQLLRISSPKLNSGLPSNLNDNQPQTITSPIVGTRIERKAGSLFGDIVRNRTSLFDIDQVKKRG